MVGSRRLHLHILPSISVRLQRHVDTHVYCMSTKKPVTQTLGPVEPQRDGCQ